MIVVALLGGHALAWIGPAVANGADAEAVLRIGLAADPASLDPHYENRARSRQIARHLFDALTATDQRSRLKPGLAATWEAMDDYRWAFRLRRGLQFHNGQRLTADDVVFSLNRARDILKSPLSFAPHLEQIERIEATDQLRIEIVTRAPQPLLPFHLSRIAIISRAAAEGKTRLQLDRGDGLVGTGPFKFVSWEPGVKLSLSANLDYWGGEPKWDAVDFYPLAAAEARLEALKSGLVDVAETPELGEATALSTVEGVRLSSTFSNRLVYLQVDHKRDKTPEVSNAGGVNPFKQLGVRRALSLAVDRQSIVREVLEGQASPAGQVVPGGLFGYVADLTAPSRSLEAARALLQDAGFGEGFSAILVAPDGRFPRGPEVAAKVASSLSEAGLVVEARILPRPLFYARRNREAFSLYLSTIEIESGQAAQALTDLLGTPDPERGVGRSNRGAYSNSELDLLLGEAARNLDSDAREEIVQQASSLAIADVAIIPLYFDFNRWALRGDLLMMPRADGLTLAVDVERAPEQKPGDAPTQN